MKTLCKSISSKDQSNFDSDIVQDILLNRIADENPEIVKYVLQVKNLTLLVSDHTRLAKALERLLWSDMNIDIRSLALPLFLSLSKDENNHDIVMTSLFACAFASNETYRFTQALHASLEKTKTPSDLAFLVAVKVPAHLENPEEMVKYNTKLAQALTSSVFEKFSALFINGLESSIASFQALSFMVINDAIAKKKVTLDICLQTVGVLSRFTEFANCELPKESLWALTGLPNASVLTGMTRIKSRRFKESKMFSNLCLITLHNLVLFTVGSGSINSWSLKFKETVSLEYLAFKMFDMISSLKSQAVVDTLTQDMFAGQFKDSQIEFCCAIVTNDVPVQSKSLAMKLLKSFLAASKMDFQLVAPSLLVACSDLDSTVRMGAFDLIKTLAASYDLLVELKSEAIHHNDSFYGSSTKQVKSLKPKKVKPFLADILTHREEIMADHSFLSTAMDKAISGKDEVLAFLLTNILAMPYVSVQSKLMRILSDVSTSSKLKTLFPLLENIRKSQSLSQEEHIFAEDILNCYTPKAVEVLFKSKNPRYASVFLDLIKFTQNGSEQHQTLCSIALRQITSDFFTSAGSEKQCLIVDALIRLIAEAPVEVTQTAREALSRIGISAEHICFILGNVTKVLDQGDEAPSKKAKKDGTKLVKTLHFVTVLLEVVESQNKISNSQEIIPHLFTLLKTALGMESSGSLMQLEYIKQLAMSTLNSVFKTLLNAKVCVDESIVDIDAIIQSVRMTQNAQTHNVAFLLLSTIATGYSNLVLKSVMPIFTFMGANVLPKDDEFSFYVIKKTVDVLLPALVLHSNSPAEIQSILDIFMDALYHIPRHRRLPIFKILVQRLGEEAYLGQILVMVISKARSKKDKSSATNLEFAHQLIAEFGVLSQLSGLIHLLNHVNDLVEKEEEEEDDAHGALQMIRFTKAHLTAKACASSVLRVPETERAEKQMTLIEALLVLVGKLDAESAKPLFEALDLVMDLLSLPKYVEAIVALMHHDNAAVCIRAISMMEEKIQAAENTEETTGLMTCLVPELLLVLQSTGDEDDDDLLEKKQIALSCLGELARFMAKNKPVLFAETVPLIIGDHGLLHANPRVSSSAMVTLSFICTGIGSRILPYLPKFMPSLLSMLSESLAKGKKMDSNLASLVCQACFMALQSVVETIPTFVSPYVSDIISHAISPVACSLDTSASVLTVLSSKVPARVVLPAIMKQIPSVFDSGPESVAALFKFVTSVMGTITRSEITDFMPDLTKFFLESFDVRLKATKLTEDELSSCETDIINSFLQLVLKLNETYFKPLFLKMVDWCTLNISFAALEEKEKIKRQLVMFKLLDEFLDRLKVHFANASTTY